MAGAKIWYNPIMELVLSDNEDIVIRFDPGEEVVSELARFVIDRGIDAASISGVGSAKEVELGFYNLDSKEYVDRLFVEDLEVLSISGNVSLLDGESTIHLHGAFGREDYAVVGGHIQKLVVNTTVELILSTIGGELRRDYDEETGLNLLIT